MGKSKHKISNWKQYNQALVQRGSLTVWMDEQAIQQWHCQTHHGRRGRGFHYSDSAIETALMLKAVFKLPLRALEGFINSLFELMNVPLQSPDYSCISKRAKTVEIKYRLPSHGPVAHLVIDATGLMRIPVKLNSDSGICEHHFRKVCGQGFCEQKLSFEGRHLFDSPNKPAAKRSAAVVDPGHWSMTVHLTSEFVL